MRHLIAVIVASCLTIHPALANEFAPCGFIKSKHPTLQCFAAEVPGGKGLIGREFTEAATGKRYLDIYMSGPECDQAGKGVKYDSTGQFQQRKLVGKLVCNATKKVLTFNGKPIKPI